MCVLYTPLIETNKAITPTISSGLVISCLIVNLFLIKILGYNHDFYFLWVCRIQDRKDFKLVIKYVICATSVQLSVAITTCQMYT